MLPDFKVFLDELRQKISVDSFSGPWKNKNDPYPFHLPTRIDDIGKYKFAIVVDSVIENDWLVFI